LTIGGANDSSRTGIVSVVARSSHDDDDDDDGAIVLFVLIVDEGNERVGIESMKNGTLNIILL